MWHSPRGSPQHRATDQAAILSIEAANSPSSCSDHLKQVDLKSEVCVWLLTLFLVGSASSLADRRHRDYRWCIGTVWLFSTLGESVFFKAPLFEKFDVIVDILIWCSDADIWDVTL